MMKSSTLTALSLGALSTVALSACNGSNGNKAEKPNVIFILMDDMGYGEAGCYGQLKIETPNIDRLAQEGMLFTQHYSGSPVSAPARCGLMTGLHSGHAQIRGNDELGSRGNVWSHKAMLADSTLEGQAPLKAGTFTIGRMMQQAGYTTACIGKWGLGYPTSDGVPNKQGFDYFFGYNCQRMAHTYYPPLLWENEERVYLDNPNIVQPATLLSEGADPYDPDSYAQYTQNVYAPDVMFERTKEFVERNRQNPFFLMITTPMPHVALQAPKEWVDRYVAKFGDEEPYTGKAGYYPVRYPHATYAAMISYFDDQIGQLVEQLKRDGIYDNTIIMFSSDNGATFNGGTDSPWFDSGRPFKSEYGWGKCFLHEGGIRVPLIVSWHGHIKAGSKSDHIAWFADLMPTLAQLTGQQLPEPTDGISYLPTLTGRGKQAEHEHLYWEYPESDGQKAVRLGKWKGIIFEIKKGNNQMQLFDLENDIQELHDVSADHPDIVEQMTQIMESEHIDSDNPKFQF